MTIKNTKKRQPQKYFQLDRIMGMKKYLFRLMEDLRVLDVRILIAKNRSIAFENEKKSGVEISNLDYGKFFQVQEELEKAKSDHRAIRTELRNLGILKRKKSRKLYFPCIVDYCDAFFIWEEGEPQPVQWKFRGDRNIRSIPECWFDPASGNIQLLRGS